MIKFFTDKNYKSRKKYKKIKTFTTVIKSFDTIVIFATTSSFFTLSLAGFGLLVIPIPGSLACGLKISDKTVYEIVLRKYNT